MSEKLKAAVAEYIRFRDERDALRKKHQEELKPYNEWMAKFEGAFLQILQKMGAEHIATDAGTVYQSKRSSVTVADWQAFLSFVQENGLWHLLEKRAAKTSVEDYLTETQTLPPGLNIRRENTVNVRRS